MARVPLAANRIVAVMGIGLCGVLGSALAVICSHSSYQLGLNHDMWKCYFLKILLKTRSVNKHKSSLATGIRFPAGKHCNYPSSFKGVSPFCGSRKRLGIVADH